MSLKLSVLTLNIWGIPLVSQDRKRRVNAIADRLASGEFDVVSLQEVWTTKDYELLQLKTVNVYPYSHYFYSGVFGSGLCILSKYPIVRTFFHAWTVNGYVHRIQHGDWFGGKGVGLCRVMVKQRPVHIYIAHLHAEYDSVNDEYKAHRVLQAYDTAQFIEHTRGNAVVQILAGDLNTEPKDIAYRILRACTTMSDTCNDDDIGTSELLANSYTDLKVAKNNPNGKRIDHILYNAGHNYNVSVQEYCLPFPSRVPGENFSYSDHEAVSAKIEITAKRNTEIRSEGDNSEICLNEEEITVLQESIDICKENLIKLKKDQIFYFCAACLFIFFLILAVEVIPLEGLVTFFLIIRLILSAVVLYFMFMATIWNTIEKNGVLSGMLSMQVTLKLAQHIECEKNNIFK